VRISQSKLIEIVLKVESGKWTVTKLAEIAKKNSKNIKN